MSADTSPATLLASPAPTLKRLTVIADDFGMAPGVDQAVVELAAAGRLSGTSVLALGSHWPHSARWLRELPQLQVGLHVDLPPGHDALGPAIVQAWLRRLGRNRLSNHLDAQFDAFERHHDRRPDYLDGHRHVHQWPVLRDLILERWARRYSSPPAWARSTRPAAGIEFGRKAQIIYRLGGPAWERRLQQHGIAHNPDFLGVYDFAGGDARYATLLRHWLAQASDTSLLMCHPACTDIAGDAIAAARQTEYRVWRGKQLDHWLEDAGCRIVQEAPEQPA
jgi:predicted glycoside hydrolase/deacetylase ChbG (UPF0249 family)